VRILCRCLRVPPSGFTPGAVDRNRSDPQEDRRLKVLIGASFKEGRGYYGSPRVHDDLIEAKERVSRKRIIRLMQEDGLKARVRKRHKVTTDSDHNQPIADNLLQQTFTAAWPNQRWVSDTTQLMIGESGQL
jgi:transposase InsO family protein